jgi:hypothetical protein
MGSEQSQTSGDNSVNIQGEDVTLNLGVNYSEARQIALDVFDANFYKLSQVAADIAKRRASEIIDDFLSKLAERNPVALENTKDPDVQYAIFTAQREYARSGDKDLSDILVDILVDRVSQPNRSILQIVFNEALQIAPKLTPDQFGILSLLFILRYTRKLALKNLDDFHRYIEKVVLPFAKNIKTNEASFQHLEYAGCGTRQFMGINLSDIFKNNYPGLFWKGATKDEIDNLIKNGDAFSDLFRPCLHNSELYQINALNEDTIKQRFKDNKFPEEKIPGLISFQNSHLLGDQEILDVITSKNPEFTNLHEIWKNSPLDSFTLTSVGIAIAHANIRRKSGEQYDINIWIN